MGGYYRLNELGFRLPAGTHVLPPEAVQAADAATAIVTAAEERAAAIVADSERAYQDKCDEGYAAGLEKAQREAVARLLRESAELDTGLRAMEAELARLVSSCVRKLMQDFDDQARAESVVRGALKQMRREKRAELRVSTAQYRDFKSKIGAVVAEFPEMELVDVIEDPALAAPQIVLESRVGRVEADATGQLDRLTAMLHDVAARLEQTT